MVAEKEDGAVVVDPGFPQAFAQALELPVDLQAHGGVGGPQRVPVGLGVILQALPLPDQRFDLRLKAAGGALRHPGRQLAAVDGGKIGLLRLVGRVGAHQAQEQAERFAVGGGGLGAGDGGVHHLVVAGIVAPVFVQAQLPFIVGVVVPAARLPAQVLQRAGGRGNIVAVEDLAGVFGKRGFILARQKVVAGVHPDVVTGGFQFGEKAALLAVQHIAHGAVPMHVGVQPGEEAAPAGYAHRVLAVGVAVRGGLIAGKTVQERRLRGGVAPHVGQGVALHLVGVEDDDMRACRHGNPPWM